MASTDEIFARVVDKVDALRREEFPTCLKCGTALSRNNTAYWLEGADLCRQCAAIIGGVRVDDALFLLMTKGYLMVCCYTKKGEVKWFLRMEMRSSSHADVLRLKNTFGGNAVKHSQRVWKWTMGAQRDLQRIGKILQRLVPELGEVLLRYVAQPGPKARSAFAEAVGVKLGRSIPLLRYVEVGD